MYNQCMPIIVHKLSKRRSQLVMNIGPSSPFSTTVTSGPLEGLPLGSCFSLGYQPAL